MSTVLYRKISSAEKIKFFFWIHHYFWGTKQKNKLWGTMELHSAKGLVHQKDSGCIKPLFTSLNFIICLFKTFLTSVDNISQWFNELQNTHLKDKIENWVIPLNTGSSLAPGVKLWTMNTRSVFRIFFGYLPYSWFAIKLAIKYS